MFTNRKERSELLEALVIAKQNPDIPIFTQVIIIFKKIRYVGTNFRETRVVIFF